MLDCMQEPDIQTFRVTLGDTGLGHGVGLGDQHAKLHART